MTREEAISEWTFRRNHIKRWLGEYGEEPSIRHYVELIDMAIEALQADAVSRDVYDKRTKADEEIIDSYRKEFQKAISSDAVQGWISLSHDDDGLGTDFPYERDGEWVIVTDGKTISVERIKKDAYDHFFPNGRWFELEDAIAWMPLPKPYECGARMKGGDSE